MATCDPNELLAEGKCFGCLTIQQLEVVEAQLLCNLLQALDPMASCDINDLLAEGKCFGCLTSYQLRQVQAQLLCNVLDSITTAIGANPICGVGSPEGVVTGTACGQWYLNTANGDKFMFSGTPGTNTGWLG